MTKYTLRDIPAKLREQLGKKFSSFGALLDGDTIVFLRGCEPDMNIDNIVGFGAVSKNAEYCLLEEVQATPEMQTKKIYQDILTDIFYFVSEQDMPLMTNEFSAKEKKLILPALEFCAAKYGVYVMEEREYLEMREMKV